MIIRDAFTISSRIFMGRHFYISNFLDGLIAADSKLATPCLSLLVLASTPVLNPPSLFKHMKSRTARANIEKTHARKHGSRPRADILEPSPFYVSQQKSTRSMLGKVLETITREQFLSGDVSITTDVA